MKNYNKLSLLNYISESQKIFAGNREQIPACQEKTILQFVNEQLCMRFRKMNFSRSAELIAKNHPVVRTCRVRTLNDVRITNNRIKILIHIYNCTILLQVFYNCV
jgi:hypothetical protein